MDDLFDKADVDQSGGVTKDEMRLLLDQVRLTDIVDFDAIWDALDDDESGEVTREEWQECFSTITPNASSDKPVSWSIEPSYRDDVP